MENFDTSPPFFIQKRFRYPKLEKHWTIPPNVLGNVRQINLTKNRDITLFCIKFSDTQKIDTLKGSPTKFFGTVRQKVLTENRVFLLLGITIFDTPSFV